MTYHWSTHQLTEFLAAVSSLQDERAAGLAAVERAAEALDAEVGALVSGEVPAVCYGLGTATAGAELREIAAIGRGAGRVELPGLGAAHAAVEPLGDDIDGSLVICRVAEEFTAEERQMLRGMSQVLGLSLRNLRALGAERALREEREREAARRLRLLRDLRTRERLLETLLGIQRAIFTRRPLQEVLDAITRGASSVLGGAGVALVLREAPSPMLTVASTAALAAGPGEVHLEVAARAMAADQEAGSGAVVAAPVHVSGRTAGGLVADLDLTPWPEDERSAAEPRDLLAAFAQQVSLALTDARTVEAVLEAHHDSVTGLPNRALFLDRLVHSLALGRRRGTELSVLFIDLDRFKAVNDTLGHGAGDELLAAVAERLRHRTRSSDTASRLGGDEFAVLLDDCGVDGATGAAETIIRELTRPFRVSGREVSISASIGLVCTTTFTGGPEELLGAADVAMYRAKKGGSGRVVVYEPRMHTEVKERLDLQADLQRALGEGELSLSFQPLVRLADRSRIGTEALLRWAHPGRGQVPPATFIQVAEDTGLIMDIGRWVLDRATAQLARWRLADPELTLNVNVSARQIMDPRLAADVGAALVRHGVPAGALTLELTETVLASEPEAALRQLHAVKELGVRLSIDDFGTGYSSLSYLRQFPVDQLKIDRSFVGGLTEADAVPAQRRGGMGRGRPSSQDAAIVRAIVQLGRSLDLDVVAEGIETEAQVAALLSLDCHVGQGYLLGRPEPAAVSA